MCRWIKPLDFIAKLLSILMPCRKWLCGFKCSCRVFKSAILMSQPPCSISFNNIYLCLCFYMHAMIMMIVMMMYVCPMHTLYHNLCSCVYLFTFALYLYVHMSSITFILCFAYGNIQFILYYNKALSMCLDYSVK